MLCSFGTLLLFLLFVLHLLYYVVRVCESEQALTFSTLTHQTQRHDAVFDDLLMMTTSSVVTRY